ncbi:DUF6455 family protein [Shimia biformata]|uniref:DUF6455 family protein n=1 Tax=Shimia biformata TaxID=1294299 RepID=UPI001951B949|nr:DUF6455 family protein [Shimia biformata]
MKLTEKLDRHSDLVGRMSDAVGTDWAQVLDQSPEMVTRYRNAVLTCTHCKKVGECQGWLSEHDHAAHTPDYCLNKDLLEDLAART